jgi:hypothetical protein
MALLLPATVVAAPIMYVHDAGGNLATVDVQTGGVNVIGNMGIQMTDIAFDPSGALYGLSFGAFYAINTATAAPTLIGAHTVPSGNALVFAADGTLYAAGNTSTNLFTIDKATGAATSLGNMGFASGGDLAFNGGNFYLASSNSQLVKIDLGNLAATSAVGSFGVANVFGLGTGDDGQLYGVAGTQIFLVNTATGAATNPVNYGGQGLGAAYGQSFRTEAAAAPEPATVVLLGMGLAGALLRRRSN